MQYLLSLFSILDIAAASSLHHCYISIPKCCFPAQVVYFEGTVITLYIQKCRRYSDTKLKSEQVSTVSWHASFRDLSCTIIFICVNFSQKTVEKALLMDIGINMREDNIKMV